MLKWDQPIQVRRSFGEVLLESGLSEGFPVRKMRRAVLVLLVLVGAGLAGTAGMAYYRMRLPDPRTADRDGLIRWIALRDLSQEPAETRRLLAQRFEEEFREGGDWGAAKDRLSPAQRERVWDNVLQLLEAWLELKVDRYAELAQNERLAFIDSTIDTVRAWKGIGALRGEETASSETAKKPPLLLILLERMDHWKGKLDPDRRQRISQFVADLQVRWVQRLVLGTSSATAGTAPKQ